MGYNVTMQNSRTHFGVYPSLLLGAALTTIGASALSHIVDNWWPFDVNRLDLVRATALGQAEAPSLLAAANTDIILAFLAAVVVTVTGIALPLAFVLNKRFMAGNRRESTESPAPQFLVTLRQAIGVGLWAAVCVWLQMNRSLGVAVALLVAVVLILLEMMLQLRTRAVDVTLGRDEGVVQPHE